MFPVVVIKRNVPQTGRACNVPLQIISICNWMYGEAAKSGRATFVSRVQPQRSHMKNPRKNRTILFRLAELSIISLVALLMVASQDRAAGAQTKRPMGFMDIMEMRQGTAPALAPDGKWALYTVNTPDWKAAKSFTDIYLVSIADGLQSTRQMTFTRDKNESSPRWSRDAQYFVFASNREAPQSNANQNQLYLMRPDGGEARKITDAKDGVGAFAFSRDGKWLAFSAGKDDDQQVWILPVAEINTAQPQQLTKHATPVAS